MSGGEALFSAEGLDEVEDYIWANDEEGSARWDAFGYVNEYVQSGNRAFRDNKLEEAITCYSRANSIKPGDPVILGNRSTAYIRISQFLKHRPPTTSEYRPLNGLDPTTHAELALKDAEKLNSIRTDSVKSYILRANALILLEKYDIARDVILSGLQIDPFSNPLRASLQNLERTSASLIGRRETCSNHLHASRQELGETSTSSIERRSHGRPERTDDFDCTLCLKLLYEPITTPCGHSFCRSCLFQSMDRGNKCPLCRTVLFISPRTCAVSVTLNNIIQKNFPEEYAERISEHKSLTNLGVDLIPLFVMDVVIPCQRFPLHIFEPRYRLMVRRIMEGNHRMGMVIPDSTTGSIADYACEVEITECEPLPDGRFYLEVESRRRFRIIQSWDQDGYRVAEVDWVNDNPPEGTRERAELQELTNNAAEHAQSWIRQAREAARQDPRRLEKLLNVEAMKPTPQDPERFSFWAYSSTTATATATATTTIIMRGNKCRASRPQPYFSFSITFLSFFFLFNLTKFASAKSNASSTFTPSDNYLIDCGSTQETQLKDGRTFKSDHDATSLLQTEEDVQASVDSIAINVSSSISPSSLPLFRTARIFLQDSTYTFFVAQPGWHWVRLYLYPIDHPSYNLTEAVFSVFSGKIVLLHQIQIKDNTSLVFKEYLISVSERLSLQFKPKKGSFAFINAIEVVSAPDSLIANIATSVSPLGDFNGLSNSAFQVCYRLNVGGPTVTSENDTLSRTWEPDGKYNKFLQGSKNASVSAKTIKYPESGATPYIAPSSIYASAVHIEDPLTMQPNVNLTWKLNVDPGYSYLIRLHFCDIVSKVLNSLYFNVYINTMVGVSVLDLSSLTDALDTAYYKDFVLNGASIINDSILVQVGPSQSQSASLDAILNGLEIMKMNNEADSFDGLFTADGTYKGPNSTTKKLRIVAAVGLALAVAAMLLLAMVFVRWQKRPEGWEKRNSFSSWLLPLRGSNSSLLSSKSSSRRSSQYGSRKSKNGYSTYFSTQEDSSEVILASENPSSNSPGPSEEQVVVVVYDNLELSPGSPLFSQIKNFQGSELAFDTQPSRRERKRKILGPTPKPVTILIDKYKKASPRKPGNKKISSPKGRGAKSKGIPIQSFGDPSQTISNLPPGAFNFSVGSDHNIAYLNPSSFQTTQALPTPHTTSKVNHEPTSGALGNFLPEQDNPYGGRHNKHDSQGRYSHHWVVREGSDRGLVEHLPLNRDKQAAGFPPDNGRGMDLDSESMVAFRHRSSNPPSHSFKQLQSIREAFKFALSKLSLCKMEADLIDPDQAYNSGQVHRGESGSIKTLGYSILRDDNGEDPVEASMELEGYMG
ncbi:hypothetical protein SO802_020826 [Lithocarpus litseifolius]|uniref:RING-type domain-containing protein n=1 Tax=Lithocarpus litseifolius TaxID=425828 RepID=A0AAW2CD04_9ROSI